VTPFIIEAQICNKAKSIFVSSGVPTLSLTLCQDLPCTYLSLHFAFINSSLGIELAYEREGGYSSQKVGFHININVEMGVHFPHPIRLHVSGSRHPKSVFFG